MSFGPLVPRHASHAPVRRRWGVRRLFSPAILLAAIAGASFAGAAPPLPDSLALRDSVAVHDSASATFAGADSNAVAVAPPPRDYIAEVRAGFTPQSRAYATTRAALGFLGPLYGILVNLFLLFSGLSARMRNVAHGLGHRRYVRVLIYLVLYSALGLVLSFPLTWYEGFLLEHHYGLSTQTFAAWAADLAKGELLVIVIFGLLPLVKLAYDVIERHPRRWGLWLALGTLPVIAAGALVEPIVIDPLFNDFRPLADQPLKHEILALAARAGIPAHDVYVADKSEQTTKFNAYVNGIGASQRIVLWDTTLRGMRTDELLFVMAHEMGHYRLHHVWKGLVLVALLGFALFSLSAALVRRSIARFGPRWGFREAHDEASIPLLVLTLSFVSLLAQPLVNAGSRRFEHEADLYALELTHANDAAARAFIALAAQNRSDPEPPRLVELIEFSHPALIDRIRFATRYRPWEEGRPNQVFVPAPASTP